jgi:hypothetical protein
MRWRKVVARRYLSLEKREHQRGRVRIRRYRTWQGNNYKWMRIVSIMDVWEKRPERVVELEREGGGGGPGNGIRGATGGGNVVVGPNSGAIVNIGNNNTAATTVNLGNTGTSMFGTVNVGRGATAVNIGDNVTSAITLGRTGGSVTLGPPLTLGAAPTSSQTSCLGCIITGSNTASATSIPTNTTTIISTITNLPVGTWLFSVYTNVTPSSITTDSLGIRYCISNTVLTGAALSTTFLLIGSEGTTYTSSASLPTLSGFTVVSNTAITTYYLNATVAILGGSLTVGNLINFKAIRIA